MATNSGISDHDFEQAILLIGKYLSEGDSICLAKRKASRACGIPAKQEITFRNFESYRKLAWENLTRMSAKRRW